MSLVGTRPPTQEEVRLYEARHRIDYTFYKAVQDTLNSVIKNGDIDLSSVEITEDEIKNFEQIYIVACGSACPIKAARAQ